MFKFCFSLIFTSILLVYRVHDYIKIIIFITRYNALMFFRPRMTDAGYYRGTTADQDTRFGDKTKKLMKTLKFSEVLAEPVDMRKVKLDALKPWVHEKLTEILGFEDDVVIDYAKAQNEKPNRKINFQSKTPF